ncbi:hypothetical protein BDV59DRAFT_166259 [Aspergillus ambiguus]|uniref:uncharacterized protein n=1 Tax=Aspergillus ambiguus TaxID=176160 RepID=UPI003CCDC06E
MPPGQPVSPLALETCSPPPSHLDIDDIIGSDEELDEPGRVAQRRRIQKLADAYDQGKPLFILSASLRGPFDNGWVNPWKKDRKRRPPTTSEIKQSHRQDNSPVVDETNPRKRRQHYAPEEPRSARPRPTPVKRSSVAVSSHSKPAPDRHDQTSISPDTARKRALPWVRTRDPSPQSYHPTPVKHTDENWLKKDRKRTGFQTIDPPTSPTPSNSHHFDMRNHTKKTSRSKHRRDGADGIHEELVARERAVTSSPQKRPRAGMTPEKITKSATPSAEQRPCSSAQKHTSDTVNPQNSLYVLSSQSNLPKFEFRRRRHAASTSPSKKPPASESGGKDESGDGIAPETHNPQVIAPPDLDAQESATLENASNPVDSIPRSGVEHSHPTGASISEKIPSAQQVSAAPTMTGYVTSLHSTAVPKGNGDSDAGVVADAEFSTQAALLLAQRSFQHDLGSPEHVLAASQNQVHAVQASNLPPNSDITPFRRLASPTAEKGTDRSKAPDTSRGQMLSTQCMINAATPFAFSTEKKVDKVNYYMKSSMKKSTCAGKPKTTSFGISTPFLEEHAPDSLKSGIERVPDSMPRRSPEIQGYHTQTQPSPLPMTLTGTTPPTAQDAQYPGADSFNLTQAIAEAGSWLQQSFDFTKDLQKCKKSQGPSSQNSKKSAFGVDITG